MTWKIRGGGKHYVLEADTLEDRVIYFETEAGKKTRLDIPVEHPIEHRVNLDNPTEIMIDAD